MSTFTLDNIDHLKTADKEKISYFLNLLLKKKEYNDIKKEISSRRKEIKLEKTISHDDIWNKLDV